MKASSGTSDTATPHGSIAQQMPQSSTTAPPTNPAAPVVLNLITPSDAGTPAAVQMPVPPSAANPAMDLNINHTDSTDSFVNLDPPLAPATTLANTHDHPSSIAIANANEVPNF
uniref:Uncharacterized protein n=1 Tax=Romanomermis culicivorax TaxID=13658 RepID=A0A915HV49_ROMCU